MLRRREFLRAAGVLTAARSRAQPRKPNLLLLVASGFRSTTLDPDLRLPHLSRLTQEGARFERLYVSCPAAGPSQASLITGRFPFACGVLKDGDSLPADLPTIATQLQAAGYQTALAGDWRLGAPAGHGFASRLRDAHDAESFMKNSAPWFLMVCLEGRTRAAQSMSTPLRANVPEELESGARNQLANYAAFCSAIDASVGSLLAALDQKRIASDTLVAFTSTHGSMLGSQGLDGADVAYEESVRVPLILRYPGRLEPGSQHGSLASNVDLAPTLLALCGAPPAQMAQGRDLMSGQAESIYSVGQLGSPGEWRMVVRGADKLVVDREQNVTHLFNLAQDPFEVDNRAQDPAQDLKRDELKALLKDWMRRTGDGMDPSGLRRR